MDVNNGDRCIVTAGRHKGKSGIVEDRNIAKSVPQVVSILSSADIARTGEGDIAVTVACDNDFFIAPGDRDIDRFFGGLGSGGRRLRGCCRCRARCGDLRPCRRRRHQ